MDWSWVAASRKRLVNDALAGLGKRTKSSILQASFTLTPSKPVSGDRAHLLGRMVGWFDSDPEDPVFWFRDAVKPDRDFDRMIAFFALMPPHCAALIDVPIDRDVVAAPPLSLRIEAWNTPKAGSPGMVLLAEQTVSFPSGLANPVHLGILLSDVGAANTGPAAGLRCMIYARLNSADFSFPSLTVTPL
jgi:hypothetical protein